MPSHTAQVSEGFDYKIMPAPKDPIKYQEWIENNSKSHKGKRPKNFDMLHTPKINKKRGLALRGRKRPEVGIKISKAKMGKKLPKMSESKIGIKNPMYGKKGKLSPIWQGGKSFEPYGLEFNEELREVIRNRDRRKCFICEKTELENGRKLMVHHIDYDKRNNDPKNLITLCHSCHSKTNYNRDYWINYFNEIIKRNLESRHDLEL